MNLAVQIEQMIAQRQEQARHLDGVIDKWIILKNTLRPLERKQQEYLNDNPEAHSNFIRRLGNIPFSKLIGEIDKELVELENLKQRLSRKTLNIGVVGRMRQGKSRLLQSLTGLTDAEIPTSSEGVCTRVLSKIFHESNQTLRNQLSYPNQEAHSKFDKFATAAFKGEKSQTAWRIFYQDDNNQALLWPGAKQKEENKLVEQEWQRLVDSAITVSNEEGLQLH